MSSIVGRLINLPKTSRFMSSREQENYNSHNLLVKVGLETMAQKISNEIIENLTKGMPPELAASIPFKKYSIVLKPLLTEALAKFLGDRILFYLSIFIATTLY